MNKIAILLLFFFFNFANAQQLNCTVKVNAQQTANPNLPIFKTLETSVSEFVNNTDWIGKAYKQNEKINCSMSITILSQNSDQFTATIQVQSSRLIYNSAYESPVLNYNDKDFTFNYQEFENLQFNPAVFESNLSSVISFYCYVILGMDADTFTSEGGTKYFDTAKNIANVAQQSGYKGWSQQDGNKNRYFLINDMMSPTFSEIRQTVWNYHAGLDLMTEDTKKAKERIKSSIMSLRKLHNSRPNSFLCRMFFDANADEIVSIFSGGPNMPIADLIENLNVISPLNASKWQQIKY